MANRKSENPCNSWKSSLPPEQTIEKILEKSSDGFRKKISRNLDITFVILALGFLGVVWGLTMHSCKIKSESGASEHQQNGEVK